jgi:ion channel-forming bestrophin family protein
MMYVRAWCQARQSCVPVSSATILIPQGDHRLKNESPSTDSKQVIPIPRRRLICTPKRMIVRSHRVSTFALLIECQGSGKSSFVSLFGIWNTNQSACLNRVFFRSFGCRPFSFLSLFFLPTHPWTPHVPSTALYIYYAVVPAITPIIILAALVGVLAKLIEDGYWGNERHNAKDYVNFSFTPFTALGVAISLFLGFHNNASYGRWWEARTLWGAQIIAARDLARFLVGALQRHNNKHDDNNNNNHDDNKTRTTTTNIPAGTEDDPVGPVNHTSNEEQDENDHHLDDWRHQIMILSIAQTHALRHQLRPDCRMDQVSALSDRNRFLTPAQQDIVNRKVNGANAILLLMATMVGQQYQDGVIDSFVMIQLSQLIDRFCTIQTSCERIHNTHLPFAYTLLVHRTSFLYVLLVPFAIVETMGWYTPVFTAILAYTFFGLDEIARQIQEPFNDEPACMALSAMSRVVERDVSDAMGRSNIPPPLQPHRSVLM